MRRDCATRRTRAALLAGALLFLPAGPGQAGERLIPYQGELAGSTGAVTVSISLYDALSGGSNVWGPESHVVVPDASGRFVILVGSSDLDANLDGIADLDQLSLSDLYLEVGIDDGTTVTTLSPRQVLGGAHHTARAQALERRIVLDDLAQAVLLDLAPTGMVVAWPSSEPEIPKGWLPCDGTEHRRSTYPELAAVLLPVYGGSGPTVFRVPDYRGFFLRGVDGGSLRDAYRNSRSAMFSGSAAGDTVGTLELDYTQRPVATLLSPGNHRHGWNLLNSYLPGFPTGTVNSDGSGASDSTSSVGAHYHTLGGGDVETRPVNAAVTFIIKH